MTGKPGDINFTVDLPAALAVGLGKAKADIRQAEQALQQGRRALSVRSDAREAGRG